MYVGRHRTAVGVGGASRKRLGTARSAFLGLLTITPHLSRPRRLATMARRGLRRACFATALFVLCAPLLAMLAYAQRLRLLSVLGKIGGGVDMTAEDMQIGWQYGERLENITVLLSNITIYSPREQVSMFAIKTMSIKLQRTSTFMSFLGAAYLDGLSFNFIAYDPKLKDTNVRRFVYALGGDEAAADSVLDASEGTLHPAASSATSAASSTITFSRVDLRRISIRPSIRASARAGSSRVMLPVVTLLDEVLSMQMLEAGLSLGLLNWLSSLVVRTLASTSIDTAASTLDGSVGLLASAIGRAIDLVDYTNSVAALPGSSVLSGATRGARRLVSGAKSGVSAVLGGVTGGAKEVIGSRPTPVGVLRGLERGVEALSAGVSQGAAAAIEGVEGGASSLVDGVEEFARLTGLQFIPGVDLLGAAVSGLASAAKGGVHVAARGTASIAGGVVGGGASAVGGAAGGLSELIGGVTDGTLQALGGLSQGGRAMLEGVAEGMTGVAESAMRADPVGVLGGGKRLVDGLVVGGGEALRGLSGGGGRMLRGTAEGVFYFGKGIASGADVLVSGVFEPTEEAANLLWGGHAAGREVCTSHRVYQRTNTNMLSRVWRGLGRGRQREVTLCTSTVQGM